MQQYESLPYCVLPLSVLQYIAVLQYMKQEHIMSLKLVFSSKGYVETCKIRSKKLYCIFMVTRGPVIFVV